MMGNADIQDKLKNLPKPAITPPPVHKETTGEGMGEGPRTYLKIACPARGCHQSVVLVCPYCGNGALSCIRDPSILECGNCHHTVKGVQCSCGFTLKPAYVYEKQKELVRLTSDHDISAYKVVVITFITLCGALWLLTLF